jgi:hypothetical protein
MNYELWHSKNDNSYLFISRNEYFEKNLAIGKNFSSDLKLVWNYKARTHFEAMQAYYDFFDYGEYKPEPDWEDTVYDEME